MLTLAVTGSGATAFSPPVTLANGSAALAASLRKEERSRRGREGPKGAEDEPRAMPRWGARAHLGKAAGAAGEADAEAMSGDLRAVLADTDAADGGMGDGLSLIHI